MTGSVLGTLHNTVLYLLGGRVLSLPGTDKATETWRVLVIELDPNPGYPVPLLLLSRFSRVRLFTTPWTAAHQAPPSMGFSRQEYWSGVPLVRAFLLSHVGEEITEYLG